MCEVAARSIEEKKRIMNQLLTQEQLQSDYDSYQIINPLLFARKLNRLLRTEEVRREFHRCSVAADAVKRWECLEHFDFQRYSPPRTPIEGERFLLPYQVVTMDWDWNLGPGRRPLYHRFVMPSLCHWRASADLMVARKLMPDYDWVVVTAEKHTAVMAQQSSSSGTPPTSPLKSRHSQHSTRCSGGPEQHGLRSLRGRVPVLPIHR